MLSKQICILAMFFLVCAICLSSCGGGGGKGAGLGTNPGTNPPPVTLITFQVIANQDVKKTVGDIQIEIPANTFRQNASVTVGISDPTVKPPNANTAIVGSQIEISCSLEPQADINILMANSTSNTRQIQSGGWFYLPVALVNGIWKIIGTATFDRATVSPVWFAGKVLKFVVIKTQIISPSDAGDIRPVLLAGSGTLGDDSVMVVHGINDLVEDMKPLGEALVSQGFYKNAWGLSHDWRLSAKDVAAALGNILDDVPSGKVDLAAHSRGVIVSRYTMEILGKNERVHRAILICGPNKGSKFNTEMDLLNELREHFINSPKAYGIPLVDTPAVKELLANSDILQELNTHQGQRVSVNYYLFAANQDLVVSTDSALCGGINLEDFTTGFIRKKILSGDHNTLVKTPGGIMDIIANITEDNKVVSITGLGPVDASPDALFWESTMAIHNQPGNSVLLKDLTFDTYNRYGNWVSCQWYDPSSDSQSLLPSKYIAWDRTMLASESFSIDLRHWSEWSQGAGNPIGQADDANQAFTIQYNLRYQVNGQMSNVSGNFILHCGSIYPDSVQIRSLRSINKKGGAGKISLK